MISMPPIARITIPTFLSAASESLEKHCTVFCLYMKWDCICNAFSMIPMPPIARITFPAFSPSTASESLEIIELYFFCI